MLHGDSYSHSFLGSVTRCFALRLLLRGEYCSLRQRLPPAKRRTTRLAIGYASLNSRAALHASTYLSSCSYTATRCCAWSGNPQTHWHVASHRYAHGRIEPTCGICWPHQHVASRLPRIDPLKNSGNRLSFTSSGSRSRWFPRRSRKASALRRILHTARRPEIVRRCSRALALLRWILSVTAIVRAFHVVATCANPRLASLVRRPLCLLLRGLCSLMSVLSILPVLLVNQHFLFCNHARAHSGVEHTSAVSTVTVRDPCDRSSSSPRTTSSRSPCITGSSCSSSFTREPPATLHTVWLEISPVVVRQHLLSRKKALFAAFTTSAPDTSMFVITFSRYTVSSDPSPCNNGRLQVQ